MSILRNTPLLRFMTYMLVLLGLCSCERETYTSWNCNSGVETKISMVLRKAQMEFKGVKLDYCGSLGNQSYFDQKCPPQIEKSGSVFIPSSGLLLSSGQEFHCVAL